MTMKKMIGRFLMLVLSVGLLTGVTACGQESQSVEKNGGEAVGSAEAGSEAAETEAAGSEAAETKAAETEAAGSEPAEDDTGKGAWSLEGYFSGEEGNFASVEYMDLEDDKGWYVGCMLDGVSYGGILPEEGGVLTGAIPGAEEGELIVTVEPEGEEGLILTVKDGEVFHFTKTDPAKQSSISITLRVDGMGSFNCAEGDEPVDFDEYTATYWQINLPGPTSYVVGAAESEKDWAFVKWTKDGEDFTTDKTFVTEFAEDAVYVAVYENVPSKKKGKK